MMKQNDLDLLTKKGISTEKFNEQLNSFMNGFPYLKIQQAAAINNGIIAVDSNEEKIYLNKWNEYLQSDKEIIKFVPASGAASRMFKDLFEFIVAASDSPTSDFEKKFFDEINQFAFYGDLNECCKKNTGKTIEELIATNQYKTIVKNLLEETGLNYGNLPKGLLKFHPYNTISRTPLEEHLVEGALYAKSGGKVAIHFTVSSEHRALFQTLVTQVVSKYEEEHKVKFNISFSEQKPSTDTVAADSNNEAFRENGEILFRPGGHGALIENLNDLDGDVVFIKNIDNVVPDTLKDITVTYKRLIAGILVDLQTQSFDYLKELENESIANAKLAEINKFCAEQLNNKKESASQPSSGELISYLKGKLNRPIRVCGMVKNEGEPGGGPYLVVNKDGSVSPQILESSQINTADPKEKELMMSATHFNPVDLVCGIKDYKGNKFDLSKFVDKSTGFISIKSKGGKELKALELPGLWNGAMSDWNTIFVEVPVATFNPVKTVNDLLRTEHQ